LGVELIEVTVESSFFRDIHNDNPSEELNYFGNESTPAGYHVALIVLTLCKIVNSMGILTAFLNTSCLEEMVQAARCVSRGQ
jgi:hypothetical protein